MQAHHGLHLDSKLRVYWHWHGVQPSMQLQLQHNAVAGIHTQSTAAFQAHPLVWVAVVLLHQNRSEHSICTVLQVDTAEHFVDGMRDIDAQCIDTELGHWGGHLPCGTCL